jgi:hypothetical protein
VDARRTVQSLSATGKVCFLAISSAGWSRTHHSSLHSCTAPLVSCPQALPNNLANFYGPDRCVRGWFIADKRAASCRLPGALAGTAQHVGEVCSSAVGWPWVAHTAL